MLVCIAIDADANVFAGECKRRDDDPVSAAGECAAVRRETVDDDLDLLAEVKRGVGGVGWSEESADIVSEDVVVRVWLDGASTHGLVSSESSE